MVSRWDASFFFLSSVTYYLGKRAIFFQRSMTNMIRSGVCSRTVLLQAFYHFRFHSWRLCSRTLLLQACYHLTSLSDEMCHRFSGRCIIFFKALWHIIWRNAPYFFQRSRTNIIRSRVCSRTVCYKLSTHSGRLCSRTLLLQTCFHLILLADPTRGKEQRMRKLWQRSNSICYSLWLVGLAGSWDWQDLYEW